MRRGRYVEGVPMKRIVAGAVLCGGIAGAALTLGITAWAQRTPAATIPDPQYAIVSPAPAHAWRLNVWTGQLVHCYHDNGSIVCVKAPTPL